MTREQRTANAIILLKELLQHYIKNNNEKQITNMTRQIINLRDSIGM